MFEGLGTEESSIGGGLPIAHDGVSTNGALCELPRKRRRLEPIGRVSDGCTASSSLSMAHKLLSSTNNVFLTEGLLKIYHDTFENALSCWLIEKTCPYSKESDPSDMHQSGPNCTWNRIYHRVFRLDRLASPAVRGRKLSWSEEKAASKAINLAVFSFATQWAQSSKRSKAMYTNREGTTNNISEGDIDSSETNEDFDRALQIAAWHEARSALRNASEIESFRVVLAHIVFSLTQKPCGAGTESPSLGTRGSHEEDLDQREDLLSKLEIAIDGEGPPIHLEQGLRLIHSLRSRMAISEAAETATRRLDAADKDTVDLLFWLGVMFDTLSSAMHKRPLVVSDEDSDVYAHGERPDDGVLDGNCRGYFEDEPTMPPVGAGGLWGNYIFARQHTRLQDSPVRWPCTYDQAASVLRDAAPVKVLLFRKLTRIQTLLGRGARAYAMEKAIAEAMEVYRRWGAVFAPFMQDCIDNHDDLPAQIQSWYICLTGHWHLGTLLLADLLDVIDNSSPPLSEPSLSEERKTTNFVATFRRKNCCALSDLARCACPREDTSFSKSHEFHFAVNQGALLTEPWTAVLIRAFAKAGAILLETASKGCNSPDAEAFRRAEDCSEALFYLGRKSDQALAAARILGDALQQRPRGVEKNARNCNNLLETELWSEFDDLNGVHGWITV
ncbi:hypothetical protein BU26DRAFT_589815 [Trematosphaeria pertusa]|uniref:C6 transcription factor AlcR n=1 Tax=Trematosphaeria pertusa TaxID=390896 RepID=A0A6A6IP35_9PLEO|nr:uncharacterized protein BU26DRAFT_589815 [Trematosphaeria pertusa]KAF2251592.1 hypothetical protein BU26DRAFT_589815 [Trematosphaeria pertusa]